MLARPSEPISEDDAYAAMPTPEKPAPDRAAAFGRAQQHSRRVRTLKFIVPAIAVVIAIAFPVYSYIMSPATLSVEAEGSAFSDGKLVMANPKLEGFTKQNLPYSMTAVRAIQDITKENIIGLEGINAKLPIDAENTAVISASTGTYDRENNTLDMNSDVTVTSSDGMVVKLKSAFLDMDKGNMKTDQPVDILRDGSRITSNKMKIENNGKVLIFEDNVRVNIDPAKAKAANNSGDQNAAQ